MSDFAKLFKHDDLGQIVIMINGEEPGVLMYVDAVRDKAHGVVSAFLRTMDYSRAYKVFEAIDEKRAGLMADALIKKFQKEIDDSIRDEDERV